MEPAAEADQEEPVTSPFLRNLIGGLSSDLGSQIRDMQGLVVAQGQTLTSHAAKLDDHTRQLQVLQAAKNALAAADIASFLLDAAERVLPYTRDFHFAAPPNAQTPRPLPFPPSPQP